MRINELLGGDEPTFSFEFFPPKTAAGEENFERALQELAPLDPSFVSVTYGAGGTTRERRSRSSRHIKEHHGLEAMAHFTCVGATTEELRATLEEIRAAGIENVLALRGDPPRGRSEWTATEGGLEYSHSWSRCCARTMTSRSPPRASRRRTSTRPRPRTTCATSSRRSTPASIT